MESRKRARLEPLAASIDAGVDADTCSTATQHASTQSLFLNNDASNGASADAVSMLPGNVFLTIWDETSDESQDYMAIDGQTLAQIKQEPQLLSSNSPAPTLPLQYRIVNQLQRQLPQLDNSNATATGAVNSQLTPMQLPSGCEIYLVKEYASNGTPTTTTIKIEPDAGVAAMTGDSSNAGVQLVRGNLPCVLTPKLTVSSGNATPIIAAASTTTTTAKTTTGTATTALTVNAAHVEDESGGKRSYILEAYKKRDDKRRATHNEVERRRRDKINNWIFKLKEMLPADVSNHNNNNNNNSNSQHVTKHSNNCSSTTVCADAQQSQSQQRNANNNACGSSNSQHSRTPPSDSKSQILIKACEYIKAMQDEIKSLRECLTENERLRLSNQRLQNELNKLRTERLHANKQHGNGTAAHSNFNITLNSLNSGGGVGVGGGGLFCASNTLGNGSQCTSTNSYTKRELIIRDYVD